MRFPSPEEIAAAETKGNGWTKAQLAAWGIPWPPPRGWRRRFERFGRRHEIEDQYQQLIAVEVDDGDAEVCLAIGKISSLSALTPDQADDLGDQLKAAAAYARTRTPHE